MENENEYNKKVGFLFKKGANRTNWKKRYFVLLGNELSYYPSETSTKCLNTIYLSNTTIKDDKSERKSGRSHCFYIQSNNAQQGERIYYISCASEEEKEEWIKEIALHSKIDDYISLEEEKYPPFKQGYLIKKGHVRRNWKQRWFVLRKNLLCYYKNRNDQKNKKPLGIIPLLDTSTQLIKKTNSAYVFVVNHPSRKVYYLAATGENYTTWLISIQNASSKSFENVKADQTFLSTLGKLDGGGEFKVSNLTMTKFSKVTQLVSDDTSENYYCVIKENIIYFLDDNKAHHPNNAISLEECKLAKIRGESIVLLSYYKQTYAFECKNEQDALKWLNELNKAKKLAITMCNELNKGETSEIIIPFAEKNRPLTLKELRIELEDLGDFKLFSDEEEIEDIIRKETSSKSRALTMRELELDFDVDSDNYDDSSLNNNTNDFGEKEDSNFTPRSERRRAVTLKMNELSFNELQSQIIEEEEKY
eukprot:TRINITY_DN5214_c0_g1_i1.p1 TRINITY_DN5214_c0_g1~~TRINITY_DN5214_c0_g1_i1.p1  ORF type:complete len:477 (+),score=153.76 TRINITY_DN5214_c0_g1_i1:21-1451(+)